MKPQPVMVTEYGCVLCQRWHRRGIDPEYDAHLYRQGKHQGPRERPARAAEVFALEMQRAEPAPLRQL